MKALYTTFLVAGCVAGTETVDDTTPSQPAAKTTATEPGPGTMFDRLGDAAGPVPGLPGFSFVHAADSGRCGGVAVSVVRADATQLGPGHAPLVDVLGIAPVTGLDFSVDNGRPATTRFEAWLENLKVVAGGANKAYTDQLAAAKDPAMKAAAAARLVQVARHAAAMLARTPIPAEVEKSQIVDGYDLAPDKIDAFCDALATAAEPLLDRANEAVDACASLAAQAGPGWWSTVCVH